MKGHLDLLVLAILRDRALYGYALIDALRLRSGGVFDLPEGTVYPALYRLERAGVLRSSWSPGAGRRRRRVYALTARGREVLAERAEEWRELSLGTASVLEAAS